MEKHERPKLNLKITPWEWIFNLITLLFFVGSVIYLIMIWPSLPNEVPAHYNAAGEVDRWGEKWEMSILSIVGAGLWTGITILEKYPHLYNYLNLTKDNVRSQYLNARQMLNVIKNIITLFLAYITWKAVQVALGYDESLGSWFMLVFLLFLFVPMGYFIIRSLRLSK